MSDENSKEDLIKKIKDKNKEQPDVNVSLRASPVTSSSSSSSSNPSPSPGTSQSSKSSRFIEDLERKWEGEESEPNQSRIEKKVFNSLKKKLFNSR